MRYIVLCTLLFLNTLFPMEVSPSFAVQLSKDAYLDPKEFKAKYKKSTHKVGSAQFNNVRFYAIEDSQNIYIVFRGTDSKLNAKTDLNFKHVQFLDIKDTQVHAGFYNIAVHSKKILRKLIEKDKPLVITGHSLGGGVAVLLGGILHKEKKDLKVFSFGAPPVGNQIFVNSIKNLNHTRYVHQFDMIPKINKPVANKFKKFFTKKKRFSFMKLTRLPFSLAFKAMMNSIVNIPYEFIHQGKRQTLTNKAKVSKSPNDKIALMKKLLQKSNYHSIGTYVSGIVK